MLSYPRTVRKISSNSKRSSDSGTARTRMTMGLTLRRTARRINRLKWACMLIPLGYLPPYHQPPPRLAAALLLPDCKTRRGRSRHSAPWRRRALSPPNQTAYAKLRNFSIRLSQASTVLDAGPKPGSKCTSCAPICAQAAVSSRIWSSVPAKIRRSLPSGFSII